MPSTERIFGVVRISVPSGLRMRCISSKSVIKSDYQIDGIDIDPSRFATSIHELGLSIHQCDIEHEPLPFEDSTFDCIIFNEIFEHLRTDLKIDTGNQEIRTANLGPPPSVLGVTPAIGSIAGGSLVTVNGADFKATGLAI